MLSRILLRGISVVLLVSISLAANAGAHDRSVITPQSSNPKTSTQQFISAGHVTGFNIGEMYVAAPDHNVNIKFVGAHPVAPVSSTPASSKGNVQHLNSVSYNNLWNGIDLKYDRGNGIIRSTYTVAPGADPSDIALQYNTSFEVRKDGTLHMGFETGELTESAPIAWQDINGRRVPVEVDFVENKDKQLGFILGEYDHKYALTIDPTVSWLTFMGDPDSDDRGYEVAVDDSDNIYITGTSTKNWGTPLAPLTGTVGGLVAKLNSDGVLQWHTFIGTGQAKSIAVNSSGDIWITGASWDWGTDPVNNHTPVGEELDENYNDIYVAKLNSSGTLLWHTFHGHAPFDGFTLGHDIGEAIAVDASGNSYIAGTSSGSWTGGNVTDGFNNGNNNTNIAVLKLDNDGVYQWNAFFGAIGARGTAIALQTDSLSNATSVFVVGKASTTWGTPVDPMTKGAEATVIRISTDGAILSNTFLGPLSSSSAIDVDDSGNAFVTGTAGETIAGETINPFAGDFYSELFVVKLDRFLNKKWHTFLGSADGADWGRSIDVSETSIFVSGVSGRTWGSPIDAHTDNGEAPFPNDVLIAELSLDGHLRHHTFRGSTLNDDPWGGALDSNNHLVITGHSYGSWSETAINDYTGDTEEREVFVAKVSLPLVGEIQVLGNNKQIENGDITPEQADDTEFGAVYAAGNFTISRSFTIKNIGTGALHLDGAPVVDIIGSNPADFTVTSLPSTPITSLNETEFEITFDPSAEGVRTATISIESSHATESPYLFDVQGTGNPPSPEIEILGGCCGTNTSVIEDGKTQYHSADGTLFGTLYWGIGGSDTRTYDIGNIGTADLNLTGVPMIEISGPNAADFTVTAMPDTPVGAAGLTSFAIKYELASPSTKFELREAIVTVANDDDDENPYTFGIVGLADRSNALGGTLTGLAPGNSIVLQNTDGRTHQKHELLLESNGAFVFDPRYAPNSPYTVIILTLPDNPAQECNLINGEGYLTTDITNIEVSCIPLGYTVGGTVSGLEGEGLVLQLNGANNLAINADGSFTFPIGLDDAAAYEVSIFSPPIEPGQDCTISNGNGIIASANVSDIGLTCVTPDLIFGGCGGSNEDPGCPLDQ